MAVDLPGEDSLPAGRKRELIVAIHRIYDSCGRPGIRRISKWVADGYHPEMVSHETVRKLLVGDQVPTWPKIQAVVEEMLERGTVHLSSEPFGYRDRERKHAEVRRVHLLWLTYDNDGSNTDSGIEFSQPPESHPAVPGMALLVRAATRSPREIVEMVRELKEDGDMETSVKVVEISAFWLAPSDAAMLIVLLTESGLQDEADRALSVGMRRGLRESLEPAMAIVNHRDNPWGRDKADRLLSGALEKASAGEVVSFLSRHLSNEKEQAYRILGVMAVVQGVDRLRNIMTVIDELERGVEMNIDNLQEVSRKLKIWIELRERAEGDKSLGTWRQVWDY